MRRQQISVVIRGLRYIAIILLTGIACSARAGDNSPAAGPPTPTDVWKQFRTAYPYTMQGVGVRRVADGDFIVVVAEPPPHVTEADLRTVLPDITFQRLTIGADGWITDGVARLKGTDARLREVVAELHQLMYGTAYKALALDLPAKPLLTAPRPVLDLKFEADDLLAWAVSGTAKEKVVVWRPVLGGDPTRFDKIAESDSLVYHSDPSGLVGWWIPKGVRVSECQVAARQFAVDSDLVVGAVGDARGVLVVGRRRTVPFELLPPLRVETIVLLAGVGNDELMQTINPQRLGVTVGTDPMERWELNLLSPELYDTEFGILLTVADVLLKSWTEHGLNRVRGFRNYPDPKPWPFEAPPGTFGYPGLVFNYNSTAAGRHVDAGGGRTVTSSVRTGVIPISYLPDDPVGLLLKGEKDRPEKVLKAEQRAYEWFAARGDPHLVRVVQYTTLYQAFRAFGVRAPAPPRAAKDLEMTAYQAAARELLDRLRQVKDADVKPLAKRMSESPSVSALRAAAPELVKAGKVSQADADKVLERYSAAALERAVTAARRMTKEDWGHALDAIVDGNSFAARLVDGLEEVTATCRALSSVDRLDEKVAKRLAGQSRGWLHSPVLIYDHNSGEIALLSGGHNLTTKTPRIRLDPTARPGEAPVRGPDGSYLVHPDDLRRLTVRPRGEAPDLTVGHPPQPMITTLGGMPPKGPVDPPVTYGWRPSSDPLSRPEVAFVERVRKDRTDAICVFAQADGSFRVSTPRSVFDARTHQELIDTLLDTNSAKAVDAELFGLTTGQSEAVRLNLLTRRKGGDRVIQTTVRRTTPAEGRPETFDPSAYNATELTITKPGVADGVGRTTIKIPPTTAGKPAAEVSFVIRAPKKVLDLLVNAWNAFRDAIARALNGSKSAADFHRRVKKELKDMFPTLTDEDLKSLRIESTFHLRLEDQYLSRRAGDGHDGATG